MHHFTCKVFMSTVMAVVVKIVHSECWCLKMALHNIQTDKICRTCLSEDTNMRSVFSVEDNSVGETTRLFEMLMSCAAVQVYLIFIFFCNS